MGRSVHPDPRNISQSRGRTRPLYSAFSSAGNFVRFPVRIRLGSSLSGQTRTLVSLAHHNSLHWLAYESVFDDSFHCFRRALMEISGKCTGALFHWLPRGTVGSVRVTSSHFAANPTAECAQDRLDTASGRHRIRNLCPAGWVNSTPR